MRGQRIKKQDNRRKQEKRNSKMMGLALRNEMKLADNDFNTQGKTEN